jgi:hypothetical protein
MDEDPPIRTLKEHLAAGAAALSRIAAEHADSAPEPICHHFDARNPVDPIIYSVEKTYRPLCPRFTGLGLEFLPDRLEAWETARPNERWLETQVPAIFQTAEESGLIYRGWTWEPRSRQPIGAIDFVLIDNRTH